MFVLSHRSLDRLLGIDSVLVDVAQRAIKITNVDFGIPQYAGLRTRKEQHELFTVGASKCDGINDISAHQDGKAFDFYAIDETGAPSWDEALMTHCACAIMQAASQLGVRVEWGGFWNYKDMPHIQKM